MALTKLTTELNKISTLATLITGQAATVKAAFDHDVNVVKDYINDTLIPESEAAFETKDNITNNRKLSDTGNFTGTWNGHTMVETDPGIQAIVNEHTSELADITILPVELIGDGIVDDTVSILTAITTAANKTLKIPDNKTIRITSQIILDSPITIIKGNNTVIKSEYTNVSNDEPLIKITSSNVKLINFNIDGLLNDQISISALNVSNIIIDGGKLSNFGTRTSVQFTNVTNGTIKNVAFDTGVVNSGDLNLGIIYCNQCTDIIVENNRITGFCGKGINIRETVNGLVSGNNVYGLLTNYGDGIYLGYNCNGINVIDNIIHDVVGNGIKLSRGTSYCTVSKNRVYNSPSGVLLQGTYYCTVSENKITIDGDKTAIKIEDHPDPEGCNAEHNKIINNHIVATNNTGSPVILTRISSGYIVLNTEIMYNTIIGGYIGIAVYSAKTKVIGNTISDITNYSIDLNYVAGYSDIMENILINPSEFAIVTNFSSQVEGINICMNKIINALGSAVYLKNIKNSNCNENIILGSSVSGKIGITVAASIDELNVNGNIISLFPTSGIYCTDSTATGLCVCNNQTISCPINYDATTGRVIGNIAKGANIGIAAGTGIEAYGNGIASRVSNDVYITTAAKGIIVTTPDGTKKYRIAVDDVGAITTALIS